MSAAQHTPGPWRVSTKSGPLMIGPEVYAGDALVAAVSYSGAPCGCTDETEANARLIAAAPALLDAVRELIACADPHRDRGELARARALLRSLEHAL